MGRYNTNNIKEYNYEEILHYVSEVDIYRYYVGQHVRLGKPMPSPLRDDKHPSWALFVSRSGNILWRDFATGESGNVIKLVMKLYNIRYKDALRQIWSELIDGKAVERAEKPKLNGIKYHRKQISIQKKYFTGNDDKYWSRYDITRDILKHYNVTPITTFWVKDESGEYRQSRFFYTNDEPMYAYKVFKSYKIYRPLAKNKNNKWRGTLSAYDIQGFEQLPDKGELLIITKSLKDVMVLYKLGYSAVAPSSESVMIPKKVIEHLTNRFDRIVLFYDNDLPGIKQSNKISKEYNLDSFDIPLSYEVKDISDFVEIYGYKRARLLMKSLTRKL